MSDSTTPRLSRSKPGRRREHSSRAVDAQLSREAQALLAQLDAIEDYPDAPILIDERGHVTAGGLRREPPEGSVGTLGCLV